MWGTVPSSIKYFVLDCRYHAVFRAAFPLFYCRFVYFVRRSRAEFSKGRLPTAMLMDVDAYRCGSLFDPRF